MAIHVDRALVLRRTPYGESSLVVQVLTARGERVHLLAKGAYRPTSRYYCVLDLFDTLELEWSTRRGAELGLLRAGSVVSRRRHITEDLAGYRTALTGLELCELAARPGEVHSELFQLLEELLDGVNGQSSADLPYRPADLALIVFELRFLQNLGLAPALERCAACGEMAPPVSSGRAAFSAGAGGRLCLACATEARASGRRVGTLPVDVLAAAAGLRGLAPAPTVTTELCERLRDFVSRFLDYHLETRPTSHRQFLSAPNRNALQAGGPRP